MTRKRLWLAFGCLALCACVSASPRPLGDDTLVTVVGKGNCQMCANLCVWGGSQAACGADDNCDSYVTCPGGDFENHAWAGFCASVSMDVTCETYEGQLDEVQCGDGWNCYCMANPAGNYCFIFPVQGAHPYNGCGY